MNFYFAKGRVALYAILKAAGLSATDEVIVPGYTCVVVPQAVIHAGAKPVYADVDAETYALDISTLADKITPYTRAIVMQHTYGIPGDLDETIALAKDAGLLVIEDCCHSLGSRYKGKEVGSFGDAAFFSSQWTKPVTTGLGGWAIVNNEALACGMSRASDSFAPPRWIDSMLLRAQVGAYKLAFKPKWVWALRDVYRFLGQHGIVVPSSTRAELNGERPSDYARTMSSWQRRMLHTQLARIEQTIAHRQFVAAKYDQILRSAQLKPVTIRPDSAPVFLRYPLQVSDKQRFLAEARRRRIEIGDWFVSPVHPLLSDWERVGYQFGSCPVGEWLSAHVVNLPTHQRIGDHEIQRIASLIEECATE